MKRPNREQVVAYAAQLGVVPLVAANYHAHCTQSDWTMKDGTPIRSWQACFRMWVEKMQNRPGCEITLHDKPDRKRATKAKFNSQLLKRDRIIMAGRKKHATDEQIGVVLAKHGVCW